MFDIGVEEEIISHFGYCNQFFTTNLNTLFILHEDAMILNQNRAKAEQSYSRVHLFAISIKYLSPLTQ